MRKSYKINETWGIECYNRGKKYVLDIIMLTVPWLEVVDTFETYDKDTANLNFKRLVAEYKGKDAEFLKG